MTAKRIKGLALSAVIEDDGDSLRKLIDRMTPEELRSLAVEARVLSDLAADEVVKRAAE